jgi:hypothetical protein
MFLTVRRKEARVSWRGSIGFPGPVSCPDTQGRMDCRGVPSGKLGRLNWCVEPNGVVALAKLRGHHTRFRFGWVLTEQYPGL